MALCYFGISPFLFAFIRGQATQIHLTPSSFLSLLLSFFFFFIEEFKKESPYLVQFLHYHYGNQFIVLNSYLYKIKLHLQQLVFFKPHLQHFIARKRRINILFQCNNKILLVNINIMPLAHIINK